MFKLDVKEKNHSLSGPSALLAILKFQTAAPFTDTFVLQPPLIIQLEHEKIV